MSFKEYFNEMTMRANELNHLADVFQNYLKADLFHTVESIADIQQFQVYTTKYSGLFLLKCDVTPVGYFTISDKPYGVQLENIFVAPDFRKNNLFAKICWFLKRYKHVDCLFLNDVHSQSTVEILKRFKQNKKFNITWYDTVNKTHQEFDESLYGIHDKTPLIVCLKNTADHSNFPLFNESSYNFKLIHLYDLVD